MVFEAKLRNEIKPTGEEYVDPILIGGKGNFFQERKDYDKVQVTGLQRLIPLNKRSGKYPARDKAKKHA